jgi:hypothetical protein
MSADGFRAQCTVRPPDRGLSARRSRAYHRHPVSLRLTQTTNNHPLCLLEPADGKLSTGANSVLVLAFLPPPIYVDTLRSH